MPFEPHAQNRWLALRKIAIFVVGMGAVIWATSSYSSARGRDLPVLTIVLVLVAVTVMFGVRYLSGFVSAYRLPREGRQLIGVGLTPDGLADALFKEAVLSRPPSPVTTAAFVTSDDVLVLVGGHLFNLTRSDMYEVRVGVAGKKLWLVIDVDHQSFALRLHGPVLGGSRAPAASDSVGSGDTESGNSS